MKQDIVDLLVQLKEYHQEAITLKEVATIEQNPQALASAEGMVDSMAFAVRKIQEILDKDNESFVGNFESPAVAVAPVFAIPKSKDKVIDGILMFGKHKARHINEVIDYDPNYVEWAVGEGLIELTPDQELDLQDSKDFKNMK